MEETIIDKADKSSLFQILHLRFNITLCLCHETGSGFANCYLTVQWKNNINLLQSERVNIVKDAIFHAVNNSDMKGLLRSQQTQRQRKV